MRNSLVRDEGGQIAVLAALTMVPALAGAGLAIDGANAFRQASAMQVALDAAAIAAMAAHGAGSPMEDVQRTANDVFWANFKQQQANSGTGDDGSEGEDAAETAAVTVELVLGLLDDRVSAELSLPYDPIFWSRLSFPIDRRSVAARAPDGEACVLALAREAQRAFEVSGSASVDMTGCTITANSRHAEAIYVGGSGALAAECLHTSGGVLINTMKVSLGCDAPKEGLPPVADPFKRKPMPTLRPLVDLSGCGQNYVAGGGGNGDCNGTGKTPKQPGSDYVVQLKPATYGALEVKGRVALAPGEYLIDGGKLKLTSQSVVSGEGVTFFLMNGATLEIEGGATFNLTPGTEGEWAGFVLVAEHGNTGAAMINGNSSSTLTGIIYMPDVAEIQYSGNSQTVGECIRIVAQEITLIGNATFAMECEPELSNVAIQNPGAIRLVE